MKRAMLLAIFVLTACESEPAAPTVDVVEPRAQRPQDVLAQTTAKDAVIDGIDAGLRTAFRTVEKRRDLVSSVLPDDVKKSATLVTVLFAANNHGEREDCGCKSNPLGGLTRRNALVDYARSPGSDDAKKWWGERRQPAAVFFVDAGDTFYKNVTVDRGSDDRKTQADYDASSVAQAIRTERPDAQNVGELDLVMGLERLKQLAAESGAPIISANLADAKTGDLVFPGYRKVERGGQTVGFVGLTKPEPRVKEYYSSRGVTILDPVQSYTKALASFQDNEMLVLLSNLGMTKTREFIQALPPKSRPDMVVVSNSNKLSRAPEWVEGVPLVEPLSQGKYFGRVDLYLQGEGRPQYANISLDPRRSVGAYRRAWTTYTNARKRRNETLRQLKTLELAATRKAAPAADAGSARQTKSRRDYLERELKRQNSRVGIAGSQLQKSAGEITKIEAARKTNEPKGDDWIELSNIAVKLEIPDAPETRKVLDKREAKRPQIKGEKKPANPLFKGR